MRRALSLLIPVALIGACIATESPDGSNDGGPSGADASVTYTWHRDVLPIVQQRCLGCHQTGGIASLPLETYDDAIASHWAMAREVADRAMPPWMPAQNCQTDNFRDERRLSQAEIDTLVTWSSEGAPEGDPADAPGPVDAGAALAWIDKTLTMGEAYTPNSEVHDDYRCFILDPELSSTVDLIGYDILPGQRAIVHHVILFGVDKAVAQGQDDAEPGPGWTCYGGPGSNQAQVLGGWVPGTILTQYPTDTGIPIEADQVVVMQVHYNIAHIGHHSHGSQHAAIEPDQTTVRLQFARGSDGGIARVEKPATIVPIAQMGFSIPDGGASYSASAQINVPFPVTLWGVLPHMHQLGKRITVEMGSNDTNTCLIDIPNWDFHWQQLYLYKTPVSFPGGSLKLTCTWTPTDRVVTWGEGTEDEMCLNYFYVTE